MRNDLVIGPNGKDVYPVSTVNQIERNGKITRRTFLIEANSRDEALGIATRVLMEWCKKEGRQFDGTRIHVGLSCVFNSLADDRSSATHS